KIENFNFINGDFILKKDSLTTLKIKDYTLFFKKLKATPESLKEQIPILFGNVTMKGGQLNYRLNEDKSLSVDSLNFDDHRAVSHGLKLRSNDPLPPYLTDTLDRSIWVDISLKRLEINRYNFELSEAKKQLKSTSITL